jgi:hypothetical protein
MFQAQLARLEPAFVDLKPSMGATQSPVMGKLGELVDRVEATTHAAASAGRGVTSQVWRDFIQKNPGIEDPFIRVVQAAPEIADAATQGFLDNLLDTLEKSGLEDQVGKITSALENYYQHRDAQGRPCDPSKGDRSCMLTKVAGGGMSVVKDVVVEVQARRRAGALVSIWAFHRFVLVQPVLQALAGVGVEAHLRGAHYRALHHFFAPYVSVDVLVPADDAERARAVVADLMAAAGDTAPST